MSNKTRLQTNNTNLQSLINKANALPDAGSGGSGGGETCTVNIVQQWGMNDDPSKLRVRIFVYDPITKLIVSELLTSEDDYEPEHSISFNAYKNYPINIIITSIVNNPEFTTLEDGGVILDSQMLYNNVQGVLCMPTSDNTTFTFASA